MISTAKNINQEHLKYPHQVAGHRFEDGKQGMLTDSDGTILKPIQGPPRGEREVHFYENMAKEDVDAVTLQLRSFVPKFFGVKVVNGVNVPCNTDKYIKLEDVTRHFVQPCILDVKVGRVIFDHFAGEDKRKRGIAKYPEQERFGFRILGMKVYNKDLKEFKCYSKSYGKSLKTYQEVIGGLVEFFHPRGNGIGNILKILEECKAIHNWFLNQTKFRFYSSSILMVYEGDSENVMIPNDAEMASGNENNRLLQQNSCKCLHDSDFEHGMQCAEEHKNLLANVHQPSVHLIDFAHSYIGNFTEPDENYLYGLQSLIRCLEELIK